jgi:hypothetical protein
VDRGIASLLQRLWGRGVNTHMSCEDNMGSVWICLQLHDFIHLHRIARECDDLAHVVDSCHMTFTAYTPEHYEWEHADSDGGGGSAEVCSSRAPWSGCWMTCPTSGLHGEGE